MIPLSVVCCAVAFALSVVVTPLVRRLCTRFGVFDAPGPLKIHQRQTPRLGGIAIALALTGGCCVARSFFRGSSPLFFAALALVWATGLIDDLRGLSPSVRLAAQAVAGLSLWGAGWHCTLPGNGVWNLAATCLVVMVFVNAMNFLDGADGLASGVSATIALTFAATFARNASAQLSDVVAWSLFGATAGFTLYNFAPASIFMGDSGSTVVGFSVAALALQQSGTATANSLKFIALAAALPLFDAALAFIRRSRSRASPLNGDRRHFYDLMLRRGWPARKVALVSYAITALLAVIAWFALRLGRMGLAFLGVTVFGVLLSMAVRLGSLRGEEQPQVAADHNEADRTGIRSATALPAGGGRDTADAADLITWD